MKLVREDKAVLEMRIAVWNLIGDYIDDWINKNMENVRVVTYHNGTDDVELWIKELKRNWEDWDYLLIFGAWEIRKLAERLCNILEMPRERVIYPMDYDSLGEHEAAAFYMFKGNWRRLVLYLSNRGCNELSTATTEEGVVYVGKASDLMIMREMYQTGENWSKHDMEEFAELAAKYYNFTAEQHVFCDIGANIGTTCIYFKKVIDPEISILAIEALPEIYRLLRANLILNDVKDILRIENFGVSDKNEERTFSYQPYNPGTSSMHDAFAGGIQTEKIRVRRFDDYVNEEGIRPEEIKYIWVDVEGAEASFVAGAKEVLATVLAPVMMEISLSWQREAGIYERFISDLSDLYRGFVILGEEGHPLHQIDYLYQCFDESYGRSQMDVFFVR